MPRTRRKPRAALTQSGADPAEQNQSVAPALNVARVASDSITGSAADNELFGHGGSDTYQFGRGDGWWTDNATAGDSDTLQFGAGNRGNLFKRDQSEPDSSITADTMTPRLVIAGTVNAALQE